MKVINTHRYKAFFLITVALFYLACSNSGQNKDTLVPDEDNAGLILPRGFRAFVVAGNLGRGRHIDINKNGDIYMALRQLNNGHGIVALRDTTNDGRADLIRYFGDYPGTGIEISDGYLYFGADTMILRYPLTDGELVPEGKPELLVRGFPEQSQHRDKSFAIDNDRNIYVNVGAPSNACMEHTSTTGSPGMYPCPQLERQAGIWRFPEKYRNGAFICFRGSWNRAPLEQEGYFVAFVPFDRGLPSGDWEIFADKFAGKEIIKSPSEAEHRPMGIVMANDGSLYVCDSQEGKIWRIFYVGEEHKNL